jgi:nucleoside transporter
MGPPALRLRLSVMMFLQYGIWGAWLPLLLPFLEEHRGFQGYQIGHMFMVGAVGALVAPWVAGQIADRYFATEKYLGISHLLGGVLVWQLATLESYWSFLLVSLVYSLIYAPTLSLTNSISFHHLPDRDRDFGKVRVWGTIGWIAVGIAIGQWLLRHHTPPDATEELRRAAHVAGMADAFRASAVLGALLGLYCFTLPHTPPSRGDRRSATLEALSEARHNPLLTLFLLAVPISCIHQFYFVHTAAFLGRYQSRAQTLIDQLFGVGGGGLMTIGQMSEILVLAGIPLIAKQVSRKSLLTVGVVAYALRMALFANVSPIAQATGLPEVAVLVGGVALHGLCFGCFIFVAFMIVDEQTTGDVRASAQSLFNMIIVGVGIIVGSYVATTVVPAWAEVPGVAKGTLPYYTRLFSVPMWASVACLAILLVFYPGGRVPVVEPARGS